MTISDGLKTLDQIDGTRQAMETKSVTLTVRLRPSIKAMAVRLAKADHRSLADYLERLIDEAAKAQRTSKPR